MSAQNYRFLYHKLAALQRPLHRRWQVPEFINVDARPLPHVDHVWSDLCLPRDRTCFLKVLGPIHLSDITDLSFLEDNSIVTCHDFEDFSNHGISLNMEAIKPWCYFLPSRRRPGPAGAAGQTAWHIKGPASIILIIMIMIYQGTFPRCPAASIFIFTTTIETWLS